MCWVRVRLCVRSCAGLCESMSVWMRVYACVCVCLCLLFGVVGIDANECRLCLCYVYAIAMHIQYRVLSIAIAFSACSNVYLSMLAEYQCFNAYRFTLCLLQFACFFSRMIHHQRSNNSKMKPKSRIKSKRIVQIVSISCWNKRKFSLTLWRTRDQNHRLKWKRWAVRRRIKKLPAIRVVISVEISVEIQPESKWQKHFGQFFPILV